MVCMCAYSQTKWNKGFGPGRERKATALHPSLALPSKGRGPEERRSSGRTRVSTGRTPHGSAAARVVPYFMHILGIGHGQFERKSPDSGKSAQIRRFARVLR